MKKYLKKNCPFFYLNIIRDSAELGRMINEKKIQVSAFIV